jgi:formyl-CoA transferase
MAVDVTGVEGSRRGPLVGLRVLELGSFIAGPFAGQLLCDYGADVIKVEDPGDGDPMRRWGVTRSGESLWWPGIARDKRSVAIDLRKPEGRELLAGLFQRVDIVVENFRPGRLTEWGFDYETLARSNPGLILVHVSGFGQSGPRADEAGFGSIGEAVGGIRFTTGSPDRDTSRCGISLGDSLAALFAVIGTLAAVTERSRSGKGQEVDVAIYEAVAALMESTMADYEIAGHLRVRTGGVLPGVAPSNVYPTADASSVLIAANADAVYRRLCAAMQRPEMADDPRYVDHSSRGANMEELDGEIAAWTSKLPSDELLANLAENGVPAGQIFTAREMLADAHYAARDMVVRVDAADGTSVPTNGVVPKFGRTPGEIQRGGPSLGEHTAEVLRDVLGADDARVADLARRGIVTTG